MKTLAAGPDGARYPGRTYDVTSSEGKELVEGGYAVRAEDDPAERVGTTQDKPLDKYTVEQLRAYADAHDISLPEDGRKADLLKAIQDAEASGT